MSFKPPNFFCSILCVIASALFFYYGQGEHPFWWLIWIAPTPILLIAYYTNNVGYILLFSFLSYFLGSMNILIYIDTLLPFPILLLNCVINSVFFAISIIISNYVMRYYNVFFTLIIFPSLWVLFEYVTSLISSAGTYGSLAYTQIGFHEFIQIASITGIWGITFITNLNAVLIALVIIKIQQSNLKSAGYLLIFLFLLMSIIILYGKYRINLVSSLSTTTVSMVTIPQSLNNLISEDYQSVSATINKYNRAIDKIKANTASVILLPEKIVRISPEFLPGVIANFNHLAIEKKSIIVFGIKNLKNNNVTNDAILSFPNTSEIGVYSKFHMLPISENTYKKGKKLYTFSINHTNAGVLICKDMDFISPAIEYARKNTAIVFVPALDFWIDQWQHARPAIIRGIEGGYSVVRNAQWGLMTASDATGKIYYKPVSKTTITIFTVALPAEHINTFYSIYGDLVIYVCCLFLIVFFLQMVIFYFRKISIY